MTKDPQYVQAYIQKVTQGNCVHILLAISHMQYCYVTASEEITAMLSVDRV